MNWLSDIKILSKAALAGSCVLYRVCMNKVCDTKKEKGVISIIVRFMIVVTESS